LEGRGDKLGAAHRRLALALEKLSKLGRQDPTQRFDRKALPFLARNPRDDDYHTEQDESVSRVSGTLVRVRLADYGLGGQPAPPEPEYPYHDKSVRVTYCGRICMGRRKINLSSVFAGQIVGLREVEDQVWLVSFLDFDLGFFDREEGQVEPAPNPFLPEKVLTMSPE